MQILFYESIFLSSSLMILEQTWCVVHEIIGKSLKNACGKTLKTIPLGLSASKTLSNPVAGAVV